MSRERMISQPAAQAISIVAPAYAVRKNRFGNLDLVANSVSSPHRDNLWQRAMVRFVTDFNFGNPVHKVNPDMRPAEDFTVVMNDAMHSVATMQERPTKAGLAMAIIGWFPGLPLVYDVPALAGALYRRAKGRDYGRVLPYAWMTVLDAIRTVIPTPGSVRSLRLPVYEYQQTMQILFADDMYRTIFNNSHSPEDERAAVKYFQVADNALDNRGKEIKSMRDALSRLTEHVLTSKGEQIDRTKPLRTLTDDEVRQYLHPLDQVRYFVGRRLSACLEVAEQSRDARRAVMPQTNRRVR